jgi:DNA-binding NtrC family response regulator
VTLAPLRERPEDLELLSAQIVARAAAQIGRPAPAIDASTLERLRAYSWPGNVRELENVLTRATLLSRGGRLMLSDDLQSIEPLSSQRTRVERLDAAIRRSLSAALRECGGRIYGPKGAAQKLGLKPTTLQSKMKKLGIKRAVT